MGLLIYVRTFFQAIWVHPSQGELAVTESRLTKMGLRLTEGKTFVAFYKSYAVG